MKILLIMPDADIHKLRLGPVRISFREAPLTLTTLAALVPDSLNAEIILVDESIQNLPRETDFDLVGISCITGTSKRAYEISSYYRSRGIPVVMGGVHATLRPDEVLRHADSVVTGPANEVWPRLLRDFKETRNLKALYQGIYNGYRGQPVPRRELQKKYGYMSPYTVAATRGCKGGCDFCSVPAAGFGWATRPVAEVIDEIRKIKARRIVFNDVSMLEDRDYAMELFTALIPEKKVWGGLCTSRVGRDNEMLELMARSGCIYLLLGLESIRETGLNSIYKGFNKPQNYPELMEKLHKYDITVQGCFIFGIDGDTPDSIDNTVDAVDDLKIDIPRYAVYTPYPGTPAFNRLKSEGRILHERWEQYDTQHVVFQPSSMSPSELDNSFRKAWKKTYSYASIIKRISRPSKRIPVTFLGNLAYRMYVGRLERETRRIYHA